MRQLEGDGAGNERVRALGQPHRPHAARTELPQQAIRAHAVAGLRRGCPHCGKDTFVGGGTCNQCNKKFVIAKLEDVFMKTVDTSSIASRIIAGDDGAMHVVLRLKTKGKNGKPDTESISILEFRPTEGGWKHWSGWAELMPAAGEIAKAILEVAP